jgi:arylamine N-acetyltransferase
MASAYTQDQIPAFLAHIDLPQKYHPSDNPVQDLNYLTALHVHTISTIPYDNLSLHYSSTHKISINPQHAFEKIVTNKRGRGGYCMENSIMFNHVLRALGWNAYTVGVRIRHRKDGVPEGEYTGWYVACSNLYEERVFVEAHGDRSQRALLCLVNPTKPPQTGYCDVGASSLDVTQLILAPRIYPAFRFRHFLFSHSKSLPKSEN